MQRFMVLLLATGLVVGIASADEQETADDWSTYKTKYVPGKGSKLPFELPLASDPLAIGMLGSLPVKGGVKLVDKKGTQGIDAGSDGRVETWVRGTSVRANFVLTHEGGQRAPYQILLTRDEKTKKYKYRADCYRVAKIKRSQIVLIDGNGDGRYDGGGDIVVIGRKAKWGLPMGKVVSINGVLTELKVRPDGGQIEMRPYRGKTARLDLQAGFERGGKGLLLAAIVTGPEGSYNALEQPKGIQLPVGRYSFRWAKIAAGAQSAEVTWNKSFTLGGESTDKLEWGAPFKLVAPVARTGIVLTVTPDAIQIVGRGGESYGNFLPTAVSIRMLVRDKETQKQLLKRSGGGIQAC